MSPLKTGKHLFAVMYNGKINETLEVTVQGPKVSIFGNLWTGHGVLDLDGGYIGIAYLRGSADKAFHRMFWDGEKFIGCAFYEAGTVDPLQWLYKSSTLV